MKDWTVIGFWHNDKIVTVGVVEGNHPVYGGDVSEISEQGCWAACAGAETAEEAEILAVQEYEDDEEDEEDEEEDDG